MAKPKSVKNREAAERVRKATIGAGEPVIDPANYRISLLAALNYYRLYEEDKVRRKWVEAYVGKDKTKLDRLGQVHDHYFTQLAALIRLKTREQHLEEREALFIDSHIQRLLDGYGTKHSCLEEETDVKKPATPVLTLAQKIEAKASTIIGELEGKLDDFYNGDDSFDVPKFFKETELSPQVSKIIGEWFSKRIVELNTALTTKDEYIKEAYSNFTKVKLRKYRDMVQSFIDASAQQKVRVVRPRKVKVKSPSDIVKRVKFMPEFAELNLKSQHPTKLVNASEVWLYNTKYRRVSVIRAVDKDVIAIKGTTIVNFDTVKSETRTLRKPEEFFQAGITKRELANTWKALKTKSATPNGRINEDTVIVAVF